MSRCAHAHQNRGKRSNILVSSDWAAHRRKTMLITALYRIFSGEGIFKYPLLISAFPPFARILYFFRRRSKNNNVL